MNHNTTAQIPTIRNPVVIRNIHIPDELFRRIVEHTALPAVLKFRLAFVCKAFFGEIFGDALFAREVQHQIISEIKRAKDEYGGKLVDHFQIYESKYPNSFPDVVGKFFFGRDLTSKCVEGRMFTHPFLRYLAVGIYQLATKKEENQAPLLQLKDMSLSFKLLERTTPLPEVKLNYVIFWLHLLEAKTIDFTTLKTTDIAKFLNLLFFGTSKVAQIGAYNGHFNAFNLWVLDETINPELEYFQTRAWTCLKTCLNSTTKSLKTELAISAGLLCLSKNPNPELRSDALSILKELAQNKDANVLKHIATTIKLINKLEIFDNLPDQDKSLVRDIFLCIKGSSQRTVSSIINEIYEYKEFIRFTKKLPKKHNIVLPAPDTKIPLKRRKIEQVDKENINPQPRAIRMILTDVSEPNKKRSGEEPADQELDTKTPLKRRKLEEDQ